MTTRIVNASGTLSLDQSGPHRADAGCICTFENERGQRLVLHRQGAPTAIIGAICDEALAFDPTFRLLTYSTPETIFTDLQGARLGKQARPPESVLLGRVGRREMLHPSMWGSSWRGQTE